MFFKKNKTLVNAEILSVYDLRGRNIKTLEKLGINCHLKNYILSSEQGVRMARSERFGHEFDAEQGERWALTYQGERWFAIVRNNIIVKLEKASGWQINTTTFDMWYNY